MTDRTKARAVDCMKKMLHAFSMSDDHAGALQTALAQFGLKDFRDIQDDEKLFAVGEAARKVAGMETGTMFASLKAQGLGLPDVELNTHHGADFEDGIKRDNDNASPEDLYEIAYGKKPTILDKDTKALYGRMNARK